MTNSQTRPLRPSRRSRIAPFIVMEVLAAAQQRAATGADVLHLEIGEPGGGPPASVLESVASVLRQVPLGYTDALGIPELRARIARHYHEVYGLSVPVERIVVTSGASGAFVLAFLAAFDAGERVAMAEPGYPAYRNILQALDVEPVGLPAGPASRFQPSAELLAQAGGELHGLIVASPANPTGTMLDAAELAGLAGWCRTHGARLISDEIYHGITFERPAPTVLEIEPQAIVVNSFSKYFCMTGWRLGWLIVPDDLVQPVTRLAQNLFISPPTIAQYAALAAFDAAPELDARVARYRRNRDLLHNSLIDAGIDELAPADGAFYLWADISRFGLPATELCRRLLADTGVAITPGVDFDQARGERWVRLSFAGDEPTIAEAAQRLHAWFRGHR